MAIWHCAFSVRGRFFLTICIHCCVFFVCRFRWGSVSYQQSWWRQDQSSSMLQCRCSVFLFSKQTLMSHIVTNVVWSVFGLSLRAMQKWLDRLRCHFGCWLGWATGYSSEDCRHQGKLVSRNHTLYVTQNPTLQHLYTTITSHQRVLDSWSSEPRQWLVRLISAVQHWSSDI